jgi:DNA invertase Pin-like site-specific DNA recombinase
MPRVSTMHNQNPEVQLAGLREHAARRGWTVVGEYIDRGITGARERRPETGRLPVDSVNPGLSLVTPSSPS